MSRTRRRKRHYNDYFGYQVLRRPRHRAAQRAEEATADELLENGFEPSDRHRARANPSSDKLPTAWDDISIAAIGEQWRDKRLDHERRYLDQGQPWEPNVRWFQRHPHLVSEKLAHYFNRWYPGSFEIDR